MSEHELSTSTSPLLTGFDPNLTVPIAGLSEGPMMPDPGGGSPRKSWAAAIACGHGKVLEEGGPAVVLLISDERPPETLELPCVTCQTGLTAAQIAKAHGR